MSHPSYALREALPSRFEIERELGQGGTARVHLAASRSSDPRRPLGQGSG